MTPLQARVKGFISGLIRDEGFSPSLQEIADGLGLKSRSSARDVVLRLQKKGPVTFLPGRSRSIEVAGQTERLISAAAVAELDEVLSELRPPETRSRRRPILRRGPGQGVDETEAERARKLR